MPPPRAMRAAASAPPRRAGLGPAGHALDPVGRAERSLGPGRPGPARQIRDSRPCRGAALRCPPDGLIAVPQGRAAGATGLGRPAAPGPASTRRVASATLAPLAGATSRSSISAQRWRVVASVGAVALTAAGHGGQPLLHSRNVHQCRQRQQSSPPPQAALCSRPGSSYPLNSSSSSSSGCTSSSSATAHRPLLCQTHRPTSFVPPPAATATSTGRPLLAAWPAHATGWAVPCSTAGSGRASPGEDQPA